MFRLLSLKASSVESDRFVDNFCVKGGGVANVFLSNIEI